MPAKTSKYLLSDGNSLRRIKFAQFRSQVPALVVLAIAIVAQNIFPRANIFYPALALAVLAIGWYLYIGLCYRFKQRIPLPPDNALVSPIQGKIKFIRKSGDVTLLNINKIVLDSVEIRSPHSQCKLEDGVLHLDTINGKASFRFAFNKVQWFPEPDFTAGNIIGMVVGAGSCTLSLPTNTASDFKEGDALDAGDVLLENISTGLVSEEPHREITLEAVADYAPETDEL